MEFDFYNTFADNLIPSLVRILSKIYASGQRCIFFSPIEERVQIIDKALWTFSTNEFIPHGDKTFGFEDKQPIYLATDFKNPNGAKILVLVDTLDYQQYSSGMQRILFFFEDKIQEYKALCNTLQNANENVNYWCQSERGWNKIL